MNTIFIYFFEIISTFNKILNNIINKKSIIINANYL